MDIQVRRAEFGDVEALRDMYRQEAACQIRYDSMLPRGLADPYLVSVDGRTAGYGAVLNRYDRNRLTEFYALPRVRAHALPMFRALLAASPATEIAAQTNIPLLLLMLYDCARDVATESILFEDAGHTGLTCPDGIFRPGTPDDRGLFAEDPAPQGVIQAGDAPVAAGGFLRHYNPPYADIFMRVAESARRRGFGSYLVQELKGMCYDAGRRPAARCHPQNIASRRTLERAGLLPCARLLVGRVAGPEEQVPS